MQSKPAFLFLLLFCCSYPLSAQNAELLTYTDFMQIVAQQHPIAKQIRLLSQRATTELQRTRGASFDPMLNTNWDTKQFSETQYYSLFSAYLQVPTWYGVEVEAGFLMNQGYYLNPENKTPTNGQAYLGIKVPLLQGLITNERRTAVEQARLLQSRNAQEIRSLLNDLFYNCAKEYWQWAAAYQEVQLWQEAADLAAQRLDATRIAFQQGDKPAFDTLESFANLLDRRMRLQEAELNFLQSQISLSNYLWSPQETPLQISPTARPDALPDAKIINEEQLNTTLKQINSSHPDLQLYDFQLQHLALEQRLKRNKILPKLDLKYNFLSYNHVDFFETGAGAFAENYKIGLKFSMPILLRQSRADVQLTQLKIQETNFKLQQKQLEIANKIQNYYAEVNTYNQQLLLVETNLQNYKTLLDGEQQKFQMGESSIFLLNSRELKLIEMQQKRIATLAKLAKAQASFAWATAALAQ
jgi:outer membrane protein TolC